MKRLFILFLFSASAQATSLPVINSIQACNNAARDNLTKMDMLIDQRLTELLQVWNEFDFEHVKVNFIIPKNRVYSDGAQANRDYQTYWSIMRSNFEKMNSDSINGINFTCRDNSDSNCDDGGVFAYVRFRGNNAEKMINICPAFFGLSTGSQVATVFHELSHYSAATEDYAMDWWTPNSIDMPRAALDAYHIQNFISGDIGLSLQRAIWMWAWRQK